MPTAITGGSVEKALKNEKGAAFRTRALLSGVAVGVLAAVVLLLATPEVRRGLVASAWAVPLHVATGASALAAFACGGDEGQTAGGKRSVACTPDQAIPCVCPNGASGSQKCQLDKTFSVCDCSTAAAAAGRGALSGAAGAPVLPITPVTPAAAGSGVTPPPPMTMGMMPGAPKPPVMMPVEVKPIIVPPEDVQACLEYARRVVDNAKMRRNFVQIVYSGAAGRKSLGSAPKRLVREWLEARDDAALYRASVG